MTMRWLRRNALVMGLAAMAAGSAVALTVPELQQQLQAAPVESVPFSELRESPWLAAPVESAGTMHAGPGSLEKRVLSPRVETWRIWPDRMEWVGQDGISTRQILFNEAPAVALLANALRNVVAGELSALQQDFRLQITGDRRQWTLRMEPRAAASARYLDHLELKGAGPRLQVIVIVERPGERTTTRLNHSP